MKIAYMFSGQGSQCAGMGMDLYNTFSTCKDVFNKADEKLNFPISKLCFEGGEQLNITENTQPAILTTGVACYKLLEEEGMIPDYCLGLSLGEFSALVASSAFKFEDAVQVVKMRGRFMNEAVPQGVGAMSAIMNLHHRDVEDLCDTVNKMNIGLVMPANYNMPEQTVVSGHVEAVEKLEELAKEAGCKKPMRLKVSAPFHTELLSPAAERLGEELKKIEISNMQIDVITNLTAREINKKEHIIDTLTKQVVSPVLWEQSIIYLINKGVTTFVELGVGKTLCTFVRKINRNVNVLNVDDVKSFDATMKVLEAMKK